MGKNRGAGVTGAASNTPTTDETQKQDTSTYNTGTNTNNQETQQQGTEQQGLGAITPDTPPTPPDGTEVNESVTTGVVTEQVLPEETILAIANNADAMLKFVQDHGYKVDDMDKLNTFLLGLYNEGTLDGFMHDFNNRNVPVAVVKEDVKVVPPGNFGLRPGYTENCPSCGSYPSRGQEGNWKCNICGSTGQDRQTKP